MSLPSKTFKYVGPVLFYNFYHVFFPGFVPIIWSKKITYEVKIKLRIYDLTLNNLNHAPHPHKKITFRTALNNFRIIEEKHF